MSAAVTIRYGSDPDNPKAKITSVFIAAEDVDGVDETDNSEIRYYLSAECTGQDTARSEVFSGDFVWQNWHAPAAGDWTFHLRKLEDDSSVANSGAKTFE
jgi:hypothetical protein